jgi:hypothetical protein
MNLAAAAAEAESDLDSQSEQGASEMESYWYTQAQTPSPAHSISDSSMTYRDTTVPVWMNTFSQPTSSPTADSMHVVYHHQQQ